MSAYLISIASAPDAAGVTESDALVSIRVETSAGTARIVEMTMRSSAPGGLSLRRLPQLDLAMLGRALTAGCDPDTKDPDTKDLDPSGPGAEAPGSSGLPRVTRAAAAARSARDSKRERAYRRMPDVDTLLATFAEIGSVTKLAAHYGVPRHTAQGWMGRARRAKR